MQSVWRHRPSLKIRPSELVSLGKNWKTFENFFLLLNKNYPFSKLIPIAQRSSGSGIGRFSQWGNALPLYKLDTIVVVSRIKTTANNSFTVMFPRIVDLISRDQSVITMKNIIAETSILFCSHSSEAVITIFWCMRWLLSVNTMKQHHYLCMYHVTIIRAHSWCQNSHGSAIEMPTLLGVRLSGWDGGIVVFST